MPTGYKMTHDEFVSRVQQFHPEITVLSKFTRLKDKVRCRCERDGYQWDTVAANLAHGSGCPKCKGMRQGARSRMTHEEFARRVGINHPSIVFENRYETCNTMMDCYCAIHHYRWQTKASNLLNDHGCKLCGYERVSNALLSYTPEQLKLLLEQRYPNYTMSSTFATQEASVVCTCKIDGYQWTTTPRRLLRGDGCSVCSGVKCVSHEEFAQRIAAINPDIEIIGKYISRHKKVACKCKICGHEWSAEPSNLYAGTGCPSCCRSHGEKAIQNFLDQHHIHYRQQAAFDECKLQHCLLFDFYLPDHNAVIEYDGEHHFMPVKYGGKNDEAAEARYQLTVSRDMIKDEYCALHKIKMIRIPYTEFALISNILKHELNIA